MKYNLPRISQIIWSRDIVLNIIVCGGLFIIIYIESILIDFKMDHWIFQRVTNYMFVFKLRYKG